MFNVLCIQLSTQKVKSTECLNLLANILKR